MRIATCGEGIECGVGYVVGAAVVEERPDEELALEVGINDKAHLLAVNTSTAYEV